DHWQIGTAEHLTERYHVWVRPWVHRQSGASGLDAHTGFKARQRKHGQHHVKPIVERLARKSGGESMRQPYVDPLTESRALESLDCESYNLNGDRTGRQPKANHVGTAVKGRTPQAIADD